MRPRISAGCSGSARLASSGHWPLGTAGSELDEAVFRASRALAERLLSGGGRASREEFLAALEAGGIATAGQRGYHIITYLAMTGTLCWGPPKGTQQALVLVEEWIRDPRALDREEALGELVARYVSGHGPATLRDFLWWSKLTMADAKIGFAVAAGRSPSSRTLESRTGRRKSASTKRSPPSPSPLER